MKKLMLILLAMFIAIPIFAQETVEGWGHLFENYEIFLGTYVGIAAIASFLGEYVIRLVKATKNWQKIGIVAVFAIAVSFFGSVVNVGYLSESNWITTVLWGGLSACLAAGMRAGNVLFFKVAVEWVINFLAKKEPTV